MKLLIAFLILTSGIESTWARGIEKAQIKFTMDVEPGQESKVAELGKMAYGKPSGTMIVSIDLNGDGVFESYKINKGEEKKDTW